MGRLQNRWAQPCDARGRVQSTSSQIFLAQLSDLHAIQKNSCLRPYLLVLSSKRHLKTASKMVFEAVHAPKSIFKASQTLKTVIFTYEVSL
jgi:hypothetical protein